MEAIREQALTPGDYDGDMEAEANAFAMELLMPEALIVPMLKARRAHNERERRRVGSGIAIQDIVELAKIFEVEEPVMTLRIQDLIKRKRISKRRYL